MPRAITVDVVLLALQLAKQIEQGSMTRRSAFQQLVNQFQLPAHTANSYLDCYGHLRTGTAMKATIQADAIRLMLVDIQQLGTGALLTALQALMAQILYLEALPASRGPKATLRALHAEFLGRLAAQSELQVLPANLEEKVEAAMLDSATARAARLAAAPAMPKVVYRIVREFERNPDVVAEVLLRANGICEACRQPAPFLRRRDGSPYLEVHHITPLADGGEDTVVNAIALCPNCHREKHFGQPQAF
ncbi:HNH endonuclease [Pseudomonas aeruginosa]|uniref:HNH endonuclease n=1 Tax=Pseudomonas aeruginosa TaxID=287 RepID=UPI001F34C977|nr:HNH endonuclease signature motif containing protein [Pseudomonas aeruginosa]